MLDNTIELEEDVLYLKKWVKILKGLMGMGGPFIKNTILLKRYEKRIESLKGGSGNEKNTRL